MKCSFCKENRRLASKNESSETSKKDYYKEEEEAGDIDDPFRMLADMGKEVVHQVTLMPDPGKYEQGEEEQEAGDIADPFAMLSDMGKEVVYQVTLPQYTGKNEKHENSETSENVKLKEELGWLETQLSEATAEAIQMIDPPFFTAFEATMKVARQTRTR